MLINEALRDMDVKDLNQRYLKSYVKYDQKPIYCTGFTDVLGTLLPTLFFSKIENGVSLNRQELFDYTKLDITRPSSRWYVNLKGDVGFLSYFITKQWSRGLNDQVAMLQRPNKECIDFFPLIDEIFKEE